jgi:serine phosphatase RsbU (regulator of sigma subunit)
MNDEIVVTRTSESEWKSLPVDVQRMLAILHPTSIMVIPMKISGRTRGVLVIGHDRVAAFSGSDVELATDVGRRTASAHERATLWQASQQRFEAEHQMVEVLQRSIVPERLPDIPGTELAAVYRPADVTIDVGGDWYDAFERDGAITLIVGDVAGHGIEAATLMGRVRNAIRAYAAEDDDPGTLLARVDQLLHTFEEHTMVTAVVVRYEPTTGDVAWSRAGHLPPLLCDGGGGIRFLDDVNSPPLGTLARGFETARARLGPGSLLVRYTDGLVERRDCILDAGLDWLATRVRETHTQGLDTLCRSLADDPFVPHPSGDDICVLAIRAATQ